MLLPLFYVQSALMEWIEIAGYGMGLIIGWWLTLIAITALFFGIIGWVTEYEKPLTSN